MHNFQPIMIILSQEVSQVPTPPSPPHPGHPDLQRSYRNQSNVQSDYSDCCFLNFAWKPKNEVSHSNASIMFQLYIIRLPLPKHYIETNNSPREIREESHLFHVWNDKVGDSNSGNHYFQNLFLIILSSMILFYSLNSNGLTDGP